MNATITIAIIAAVIIIAIVVAWILTSNKAKAAFKNELNMKVEELGRKETEVRTLAGQVAERDADLIRKEADVRTAEALRESERKGNYIPVVQSKIKEKPQEKSCGFNIITSPSVPLAKGLSAIVCFQLIGCSCVD